MAGDWIKMRGDLAEDPAVIAMAAKLGIDEFAVVGRLHNLWGWLDRQSRDGHASGVTQMWVDRRLQCDGFAQAMSDVGWLDITPAGISLPKFDRHNGETAKTRGLGTKRKQKERDVTQNVTPMSRNDRDKSETREEKRREEKKEEETQDTPAAKAAKRSPSRPECPPDVEFQTWEDWCSLRTKKRTTVSETVINEARAEALKAGMTLQRFLTVWCLRGSQGMQADWLKPGERGHGPPGAVNKQEAQEARNSEVSQRWLSDQGIL